MQFSKILPLRSGDTAITRRYDESHECHESRRRAACRDVLARGLAARLSDSLGQQVVIDNRPGAAGALGVGMVAKSLPDGYTLMMTDVPSHAISASLYTSLPYDPLKDIEPI